MKHVLAESNSLKLRIPSRFGFSGEIKVIKTNQAVGDKIISIYLSIYLSRTMSEKEERKRKRKSRLSEGKPLGSTGVPPTGSLTTGVVSLNEKNDERFSAMKQRNEDQLLQFVAQVNKVYQELLKRPAPFMTFVFAGMQSAGKSTIMERFLNSVLNIVQEGTGTRCPLDATCIHDDHFIEARCELSGKELPDEMKGRA